MAKARVGIGLVAGCLLLWGGSALAGTLPTVAQMLSFRPRLDGVVYGTPTAQEEASCKVELVTGGHQGSGYLLRDPQGRPLRRFYNTRFTSVGDKTKIDVWSYYKDGVEVYREWATNNGEPPDQFRWLNGNGSKWGAGTVDAAGRAHITTWKQISAEEVGQELLQAAAAKDFARLQPLFLSDADMKALELPAAEVSRLQELRRQAPARFESTVAKLQGLSDKTHWLHLETPAPQCLPREQTGAGQDLVKYTNATVLAETAGKNDWLQTGELFLVGQAWRIVDAPTAGPQEPTAPDMPGAEVADKEVQPLLDKLRDIDAAAPKGTENPGPNPTIVRYNLNRADVLEQIVSQVKPDKREQWIRQLADCLSAASQASPANDRAAYKRLLTLEEQISKAMPGSVLAGYVAYREMTADNAAKIAEKGDFTKVQEQWLARLAKFVETYPRAEDTPDALLQLGWVSEFMNKEIEAKNWYQQLATNFADKPVAQKAQGALRRLDLEGKPMELTGPALAGGAAFDVAQLHGKVVVVYYWATWNDQATGDFAKLKGLLDKYGAQGLELVTVNLDTRAEEAADFLKRTPLPGNHLYQAGGLDSPLAVQYGVMGLPNLFLVGKDGKVLSRTVQVGTLEESVKQQLK